MVYLFVGCLPFSRYAFVEPALDMKQDTWLRAHVAMFEAFGGSSPRIVPDNLKTGVLKHPREGEIVLNDAYREMAAHYRAAVLPGRTRAPKDKASVENTVSHVATWIIAGLRQARFQTLPELRAAIIERVAGYNAEPFQKRPGSRASVFAAHEQSLLTPLPQVPYEISHWVYGRRVARNGHVSWQRNHYSVPFAHIGTKVDLRITDRVLEAYRGTERLSSHLLLAEGAANEYRTNDADLPTGERYQPWDGPRVRSGPSESGLRPSWSSTGSSSPYRSTCRDSMLRWRCCGCRDVSRQSGWRPPAGSAWLARSVPHAMPTCSRSLPLDRTGPNCCGHHENNASSMAAMSAVRPTTQKGTRNESDRYRDQAQVA